MTSTSGIMLSDCRIFFHQGAGGALVFLSLE